MIDSPLILDPDKVTARDYCVYAGIEWFKACGNPCSHLFARIVASEYHDGQSSRLYKLASTGTIDNSDGMLGCELEHAERAARANGEPELIPALRAYIRSQGTRGPVKGWSLLRY